MGAEEIEGDEKVKKYALFLGCLIPQRLPSAELATRKVFSSLGLEIADMSGYTCCPDPILARLMDRKVALSLSARNLSIAEKQGLDVVVLCNGCFETLWEANEALKQEETAGEINELLTKVGRKYGGTIKVRHIVEVLHEDVGVEAIKERVKKPLNLKLAVHYGCHLFREEDGGDIWRKPRQFEELVRATGAEVIRCDLDQMCCGFPTSQVDEEFSLKHNLLPKLKCYQHAGVDGVTVVCPACNVQFESGQLELRRYGEKFSVPCLHLVELLALAFSVPAKELSLEFHRSPVSQLAARIG
ncbi:MAG: heterodisulfide reductase-related iron-sulfur binding cluster [Hadesarchaea archaeon]|nr:heterodisulfide reductase-related iron-sulfur binding cluster [Hadesarchaea archaeon]